MPFTTPSRLRASRRRVLFSLGSTLLLSACGASPRPTAATAADRSSGPPDGAVRARGAAASRALLAHYDATLTAFPALAPTLRPLRAEVAAHESAFGGGGATPSASATPSGRPGAAASPASPPPVPAHRSDAVRALADAERHTAQARQADLRTASPPLARLLASVAACGAGHALLLGEAV